MDTLYWTYFIIYILSFYKYYFCYSYKVILTFCYYKYWLVECIKLHITNLQHIKLCGINIRLKVNPFLTMSMHFISFLNDYCDTLSESNAVQYSVLSVSVQISRTILFLKDSRTEHTTVGSLVRILTQFNSL